MRRSCALLLGFAVLSGGCTTVPTVMAINGQDSVPLSSREQVHDALGTPIAVGTVDGVRFEEFQIRDGCNVVVWGYRVPAFLPLEEFHIQDGGDLRVIAVQDVSGIPTKGKNTIVVAAIENVLHFRLFDEDGIIVVDTDETKLPAQAGPIGNLRKQLENLWSDHTMTDEEIYQITNSVALIVCQTPPGSFELGVGTVKNIGPLIHIITHPTKDKLSGRVLRDQILRFEYDQAGKVTKVYRDGNYLLSPTKKPDFAATTTPANEHRGCILIGFLSETWAR